MEIMLLSALKEQTRILLLSRSRENTKYRYHKNILSLKIETLISITISFTSDWWRIHFKWERDMNMQTNIKIRCYQRRCNMQQSVGIHYSHSLFGNFRMNGTAGISFPYFFLFIIASLWFLSCQFISGGTLYCLFRVVTWCKVLWLWIDPVLCLHTSIINDDNAWDARPS
jgi:hypothetical protein